jgi:hypothetical protein
MSDNENEVLEKPKRAQTEKQKEAFIKAQAIRQANIQAKRKEKELAKTEEKVEKLTNKVKDMNMALPKKAVKVPESDSESDEIFVKMTPKKHKKKRIIYVEPESSSSCEEEVIQKPKPKKQPPKVHLTDIINPSKKNIVFY